MAHHNSTPESVLTAPSPMTWTAFQPTYLSRAERRKHGLTSPGTNGSYVRSAPRRGQRVKRHRDVLRDFVEVPRPE